MAAHEHDPDSSTRGFARRAKRKLAAVLNLRRAEGGSSHHSNPQITVEQMIDLVYPYSLPATAREAVAAAAGGPIVGDLPTLRRMLSAVDRNMYPSFLTSRFGPEDVVAVVVNGVAIHVDSADPSISQTLIHEGHYEPHISAVFEKFLRPGHTVLDVGANIGVHSVLASKLVGPSGRVIAVEPYSENCRLIIQSFLANNFTNLELHPVAADDQIGWTYFGLSVGSNAGLFDDFSGAADDRRSLVVPRFPLDSIVSGTVDLIKLDVEGAEPRAVRGMARLIEASRPVIVTEFCPAMLMGMSRTSASEYLDWFVARGYSVSLLDRVTLAEVPLGSPVEIAREWGDSGRIEDLLLLPGA